MKNVKYVPHTLALLVALSLPLQAVAVELADVPQNHWARAAVTEATGSRQLMSGMKDGTFKGDGMLSRLQFAYVLKSMIREFELAAGTDLSAANPGTVQFTDMGSYPADIVSLVQDQANRYGAFEGLAGTASGKFNPGKTITRYEYAQVINNLLRNAEAKNVIKGHESTGTALPFADVDPAHADTVELAWRRFGVMSGFPNNTFRGNENMTRYQFAAAAVKVLPTLKSLIVVAPTPAPTAAPTQAPPIIITVPVPMATATPVPTPTPVLYQPVDYEIDVVYGVLPNDTAGLGATNGLFGIRANAGQNVGETDYGTFVIQERAYLLPTAPVVTTGSQGALGLGLGYRWKVAPNFHIMPTIGADVWTGWETTGLNNLLATAGGGLGFEWWIIPQLSMTLNGEVRQGFTKFNINPKTGSDPNMPALALMYGGDFKLRYYPISKFAIHVGASAWGIPEVGGTGKMNLLAGPNAGIAWQF